MIKNFLLDMGNVVLRWDPRYIVSNYTKDPEIARLLFEATVHNPDWGKADAGEISDEEIYRHALTRVPEALHPILWEMLQTWHLHMLPMPGVEDFVRALKQAGYKVYILSNASKRFPACIEHLSVYQMMDGAVFSAHEGLIKPDPRIYRLALDRFGLKAEECVFLDDLPINVEGAKACGLEAFVFDGDFAALRDKLTAIGVQF